MEQHGRAIEPSTECIKQIAQARLLLRRAAGITSDAGMRGLLEQTAQRLGALVASGEVVA
jgi:hypothetical protein